MTTANSAQQQEILNKFKGMRSDLQRLAAKIGELESEKEEHKLVIDTLNPLDKQRRCHHLMNGILVGKTIEQVLPALDQNHRNLCEIIEKFVKMFADKEKEMLAYQEKYQIRIEPSTATSAH